MSLAFPFPLSSVITFLVLSEIPSKNASETEMRKKFSVSDRFFRSQTEDIKTNNAVCSWDGKRENLDFYCRLLLLPQSLSDYSIIVY